MNGHRPRHSLAQLLEQRESAIVVTLVSKHGARISLNPGSLVCELINTVRGLGDRQVMDELADVVSIAGDLRSRVNPKYRFDRPGPLRLGRGSA